MTSEQREALLNDKYFSNNAYREKRAREKSKEVNEKIRAALADGLTEIGEEEVAAIEDRFCAVEVIIRRAYDKIDADEVFTADFLASHKIKRTSHKLTSRTMSRGTSGADVCGRGVCVQFMVMTAGLE